MQYMPVCIYFYLFVYTTGNFMHFYSYYLPGGFQAASKRTIAACNPLHEYPLYSMLSQNATPDSNKAPELNFTWVINLFFPNRSSLSTSAGRPLREGCSGSLLINCRTHRAPQNINGQLPSLLFRTSQRSLQNFPCGLR